VGKVLRLLPRVCWERPCLGGVSGFYFLRRWLVHFFLKSVGPWLGMRFWFFLNSFLFPEFTHKIHPSATDKLSTWILIQIKIYKVKLSELH
jgi:hypothetical protein